MLRKRACPGALPRPERGRRRCPAPPRRMDPERRFSVSACLAPCTPPRPVRRRAGCPWSNPTYRDGQRQGVGDLRRANCALRQSPNRPDEARCRRSRRNTLALALTTPTRSSARSHSRRSPWPRRRSRASQPLGHRFAFEGLVRLRANQQRRDHRAAGRGLCADGRRLLRGWRHGGRRPLVGRGSSICVGNKCARECRKFVCPAARRAPGETARPTRLLVGVCKHRGALLVRRRAARRRASWTRTKQVGLRVSDRGPVRVVSAEGLPICGPATAFSRPDCAPLSMGGARR